MNTMGLLIGLEAVRRRPGMYVGDTHDGTGIVAMIWEVVANALDEHLAGRCSTIDIEISEDDTIAIEDDGRGMPLHHVDGISFAERALTTLHHGPTMDGHAPHEHLAPHGAGVFVVCALSSHLELHVCRDGRRWMQRFARGVAISAMSEVGPADRTGTRVAFVPDADVFERTRFDPAPVVRRLQELALLFPSLTLRFRDRRELVFREPRGLVSYVDRECRSRMRLHADPFVVDEAIDLVGVEVAARWNTNGHGGSIESYANVLRTTDGGTHVRGLIDGLVDGLRAAMPDACVRLSGGTLERIVMGGLSAIVCVRLRDPAYGAPTRDRLATQEAGAAVRVSVGRGFAAFLRHHPEVAERMAERLTCERETAMNQDEIGDGD